MAKDKAGVQDQMECAVAGPTEDQNGVGIAGAFDMACWETGPDGQPRQVWKARAKNGVVQQGLGMLLNVGVGGQRATTNGPFMVLHNASYNSTQGWAQLSGSLVSGYSASFLPASGHSTTNATAGSLSFSNSFSFSHANTQTVSGAALIFYTSASCSTAPANSSDVKLYNIGTFTAAQAVQSNNTLSVTVTLNISTM